MSYKPTARQVRKNVRCSLFRGLRKNTLRLWVPMKMTMLARMTAGIDCRLTGTRLPDCAAPFNPAPPSLPALVSVGVVGNGRFELPAYGSGDHRSIHLS
jgi:hypothetical protein